MTTLTTTTPFGTFSRSTDTMYTHVAVFTKEGGIGLRGAALVAAQRKGLPTTTEFDTVWSRSEANARKAKGPYQATLVGVFPVDQDTDAMLAEAIAAQAPAPEPVVEPTTEPELASQEQLDELDQAFEDKLKGEVLTRQEAANLIGTSRLFKQVGKVYTHRIKADKKDPNLARTLCGVPINGAAQNWLFLNLDEQPSCLTCQQTSTKLAKLEAKAAAKVAA